MAQLVRHGGEPLFAILDAAVTHTRRLPSSVVPLSRYLLVAPAPVPCGEVEHKFCGKHDPHVLLRLPVGQNLGLGRAHSGVDREVIFFVQSHARMHRGWVWCFESSRA